VCVVFYSAYTFPNRKVKSGVGELRDSMLFIYNYIANGATTYPGLHNHTAVRSKEYASPTRLARSTSGKVPPARFVDRSPSIRPAHGNHKNKPPN